MQRSSCPRRPHRDTVADELLHRHDQEHLPGVYPGVAEIMGKAQMEAASSFKFFESFMAVALIYWVVVIFFTRLQHLLEVRLNSCLLKRGLSRST